MEIRTWTLKLDAPKFWDYMQLHMMPLEQRDNTKVKVLATVTCLNENQIHVYLAA